MRKLVNDSSGVMPGDVRGLGMGDTILFRPSAAAMGRYWDAIGAAVLRGVELRILDF